MAHQGDPSGSAPSFYCIHVCKAQLKPELRSLCNYSSVGLQGHSVDIKAPSLFCRLFILQNPDHLFLIKAGWGASGPCNYTPPHHCASVSTCLKNYLHTVAVGRRLFDSGFSLLELIKCLYNNISFAFLIPSAEFCLLIKI